MGACNSNGCAKVSCQEVTEGWSGYTPSDQQQEAMFKSPEAVFSDFPPALSPLTSATEHIGTFQQLQWLNYLIKHTWPGIRQLIGHMVEEKIVPLVCAQFTGLKMKKFTIGDRPGIIKNVDVHELPHGISCVHANMECESEMEMEWEMRNFSFGVRKFSFTGCCVFLLRPFIEDHPGTGGATMYFINPPDINFEFTGLARVAEARAIKRRIVNIVCDCFADLLVLPNTVTQLMRFSDYSLYPLVLGDPNPIGVLRVTTLNAEDMVSGDYSFFGLFEGGVDDNYIRVTLGTEHWDMKTKASHLGERRDFFVYDPEQRFKLDLWDEDMLTEDDHLGSAGPYSLHEAAALNEQPIQLNKGGDPANKGQMVGIITLRIEYYRGIPRSISDSLNAVMLPVREARLPASMRFKKIFLRAQLGDVQESTRIGTVMNSPEKEELIHSVMEEMAERLRKHGLKENEVKKLTQTAGLSCGDTETTVAINQCLVLMVDDVATLDNGVLSMTLMEKIDGHSVKSWFRKTKTTPDQEVELGRALVTLTSLQKAPNRTMTGPLLFKNTSGDIYDVEVSPFLCGFVPGEPEKVVAGRKRLLSSYTGPFA